MGRAVNHTLVLLRQNHRGIRHPLAPADGCEAVTGAMKGALTGATPGQSLAVTRNRSAIMLEPVDPAKRTPDAPDEQGARRVHEQRAAATARPAAGRPGIGTAVAALGATRGPTPPPDGSSLAYPGACPGDGSAARGRDDASWSSDWLQLSHELRTPLNAILGNIEILLDGSAGPLAAPVRACIGDIQVASRQLLSQLQPLFLLVQARTSGPLRTGLPIDLLALIRQAVADGASRRDTCPGQDRSQREAHLLEAAPEGASLMVPGDPIWLGILAATLVDLHAGCASPRSPLSIDLAPAGAGAGGVVVRASWPAFDPAAPSPLPLALIDAVLALHGGRIRSLAADGLRLDLPGASVMQCSMSDAGHR